MNQSDRKKIKLLSVVSFCEKGRKKSTGTGETLKVQAFVTARLDCYVLRTLSRINGHLTLNYPEF